jgi:predicted transcriptional regulator
MDKVFSTRLDEDLIRQINTLAVKKSMRKKTLIEKALRAYLNTVAETIEHDILDRSFAVWQRDETPEQTISRARKAFREGLSRHGQTDDAQ